MTSADYLSRPYARRLVPDDSGGYVASIQEFPGLIAEGDSAEEALSNLEKAAQSWIEASLETGKSIPEPIDFEGYSGKIALRIPRGLHKRAAEMALSEGVSLNLWLTGAISHYLGGHDGLAIIARNMVSHFPSVNFTNISNTNFYITDFVLSDAPSTPGIVTMTLPASYPSYSLSGSPYSSLSVTHPVVRGLTNG